MGLRNVCVVELPRSVWYVTSLPPGPDRMNIRSATPVGFAQAVYEANSWK